MVDVTRDDFLAGARFADNQHIRVATRDHLDHVSYPLDAVTAANEVTE